MIRKRYYLPLLAALTVVGLLGAWVVGLELQVDSIADKFDRIQVGMTLDEALAVMGVEPSYWFGTEPPHTSTSFGRWPPPPATNVVMIHWNREPKIILSVTLDDTGHVNSTYRTGRGLLTTP